MNVPLEQEKNAFHFLLSFYWTDTKLKNVLFSPIQVFMGNQNHDTPEVRTFDPVLMRFLRVYPERGSPDGIGLRLEVLGCDLQGE